MANPRNGSYNTVGPAGSGGSVHPTNFKLVAEKLVEWEWYERFIAQNPDLKLRWEQHKTYEILNNPKEEGD